MNRDALVAEARSIIAAGSPSFRAASRLFDPVTRERAWLLYAWCRHCDDVCDGQLLGFAKGERGSVAALREGTRRAIAGETTGVPAFDCLGQLLRERAIPTRYIDDHLQGFAMDEAGWRPATSEDLERYCYHVAGAVGCMMAVVMGVDPDDRAVLDRASDLGIAFQLSNIARDVAADSAAGRCYLPSDWLDEEGVEGDRIMDPRNRTALVGMVARITDMAAARERASRAGVPALPYRSRLAVLTATRIYGAIGRQVAALGPRAWDERVRIGKPRKLAYLIASLADPASLGHA